MGERVLVVAEPGLEGFMAGIKDALCVDSRDDRYRGIGSFAGDIEHYEPTRIVVVKSPSLAPDEYRSLLAHMEQYGVPLCEVDPGVRRETA